MKWKLVVTPKVQDELRKFPPQTKRYIRRALEEIQLDPLTGKTLRDELSNLRSFRVRRFRIIYQTQRTFSTVTVLGIGLRRTIYDEMAKNIRTS